MWKESGRNWDAGSEKEVGSGKTEVGGWMTERKWEVDGDAGDHWEDEDGRPYR